MSEDNLSKIVSDFFGQEWENAKVKADSVFFCRRDGVPLYFMDRENGQRDQNYVGALVGGVWQAAHALTGFIPAYHDQKFFRLSFDTSSQGVYILPFTIKAQEYYLGIIYSEDVNPGLTKSRLRDFLLKLERFVEKILSSLDTNLDNNRKSSLLFKDITDDEMDRLFSSVGDV